MNSIAIFPRIENVSVPSANINNQRRQAGTGGGSIAIPADATVKVDCELSAFEEEVQTSTRAPLIEHVSATSANTGGKGSYNKENMLLVKNIPLEVTKKELRQVSSPYGQIKCLKLPKTDDNSEVRCGFIEFATMYEAFHAKKALSCTHLYGRLLEKCYISDLVNGQELAFLCSSHVLVKFQINSKCMCLATNVSSSQNIPFLLLHPIWKWHGLNTITLSVAHALHATRVSEYYGTDNDSSKGSSILPS